MRAAAVAAAFIGLSSTHAVRLRAGSQESPENALLSWSSSQGITGVEKMKFALFNYSGVQVRGMAAVGELESGAMLELPQDALLTATNTKLSAGLFSTQSAEPRIQLLGLVALHKGMGSSSPFANYLTALPSMDDFAGFHPMFAHEEIISTFSGTPIVGMVQKRQEEVSAQFQQWQQLLTDSNPSSSLYSAAGNVGEEDFKWAYMVCLTRCFGLHVKDDSGRLVDTPGLVPVGDNCNTAMEPNVWWAWDRKDPDHPVFKFEVIKSIPSGGEILIPYAGEEQHYSNDDFADEWGFAEAGNPYVGEAWPSNDTRCAQPLVACAVPAGETQPAQWSTFASLSREHCGLAHC